MTTILTPREYKAKMRNTELAQIAALEAALAEYRKMVEYAPLIARETGEYLNVLDAVYSLTEIDAVHDKAREIEDEISGVSGNDAWQNEADVRYDDSRSASA